MAVTVEQFLSLISIPKLLDLPWQLQLGLAVLVAWNLFGGLRNLFAFCLIKALTRLFYAVFLLVFMSLMGEAIAHWLDLNNSDRPEFQREQDL